MQAIVEGKLFDTNKSILVFDSGVWYGKQHRYYRSSGGIFFLIFRRPCGVFPGDNSFKEHIKVFQSEIELVNQMQEWEFKSTSREKVAEIFCIQTA